MDHASFKRKRKRHAEKAWEEAQFKDDIDFLTYTEEDQGQAEGSFDETAPCSKNVHAIVEGVVAFPVIGEEGPSSVCESFRADEKPSGSEVGLGHNHSEVEWGSNESDVELGSNESDVELGCYDSDVDLGPCSNRDADLSSISADELEGLARGGEEPVIQALQLGEPIGCAASAIECPAEDAPSPPTPKTLSDELRMWATDFSVGRNAIDALLPILRRHCHEALPKCAKSLLGTPRSTADLIKNSCGGQLWYGGIVNGIKSRLSSGDFQKIQERRVVIDVFVDGLSPYESVKKHLCAIVGSLVGHTTQPFEIALWCGDIHEPDNVHEFFEDFVAEARTLLGEGFDIDGVDGRFSFDIDKYIADALARAWMMMYVMPPGAFFCCERCTVRGRRSCNRTLFDPQTEATLRTDESLIQQAQAEHHVGVSPLITLGVKPVSQVPIEPMHNVHLGVTRRFYHYMFGEKKVSKIRLGPAVLRALSSALMSMKPYYPTEYNRKLRPLTQWTQYKASELRRLGLYDSFFLLPQLECRAISQVHRLFGCAIRILSDKELVCRFQRDADRLLRKFVVKSNELFGELFTTFNLHCLIHLTDDARRHGPLDSFSAWKYETHLGQIKNMLHAPGKTLQQIVNRLCERRAVFASREETRAEEEIICLSQPHNLGPTVEPIVEQFRKVSVRDVGVFRIKSSNDTCFLSKEGEVCVVRNITRRKEEVNVVCRAFSENNDFFSDPFPSSAIGIAKVKKLGPLKSVPISDIKSKVVLLPLNQCDVKDSPDRLWMDNIECLCLPMLHHPSHDSDSIVGD